MPRKNWVFFGFYILVGLSTLVTTLAIPSLRENRWLAYAPGRPRPRVRAGPGMEKP